MLKHVESWLDRFDVDAGLRPHLLHVLVALPDTVRNDLIDDPRFSVCDYQPGRGGQFTVAMGSPGNGASSRSIVFKRTLATQPVAFIRYVVAHELAHAHLRNADADPHEPAEIAADDLAAEWGFPSPNRLAKVRQVERGA